jgi:hypothetical protein
MWLELRFVYTNNFCVHAYHFKLLSTAIFASALTIHCMGFKLRLSARQPHLSVGLPFIWVQT